MGGEDRAQCHLVKIGGDFARGELRGGDLIDRLRQPGSVPPVDGLELATAVNLLGDVDQVEVGGEGTHQPGRAPGVERGEEVGGVLAIGADQVADALEEVEEIGSLLADERASEHGAEL